ncbi:MAG: hypothetical protein K1X89_20165 [Myxococcaceae bacterium]|nr:hypothetical protein [Myxococcaceae bacterium]
MTSTRCLVVTLALAACSRSPSPAPEAAPGPSAEAPTYRVALEPGPGPGALSLRLTARPPFHVNGEFPLSFTPDGASTVRFDGARVALTPAERTPCDGSAADACAVRAGLPFTAPAPGPARVSGTVSFSVCNPEHCLLHKQALAQTVDIPGA